MTRLLTLSLLISGLSWAGTERFLSPPLPEPEMEKLQLFSGQQEFDVEFEALLSDDLEIFRGATRYSQRRGDWSLDLGVSTTDYAIEYQPFVSLGGSLANLDETTTQGSLTVGYALNKSLETTLSLNLYDGFSDYRSIWIAEYYRQTFNFPTSGYQSPDPHGFSITSAWILNPKPGTRLSFNLTYGEDTIAPGWSLQDPGNDLLKTRAASLRWEQALNPRLKTETSFTYSDITDREARMNLQSSWNFALTDSLTFGAQIGGSIEEPNFESIYGGLSLTYEVNEHLTLSTEARLYDDSGEIETSGFNSSAPGLQSSEIGISALYENGPHALRLGLSCYLSDYASTGPENEEFTHLYEDRNWWGIRAAYSLRF